MAFIKQSFNVFVLLVMPFVNLKLTPKPDIIIRHMLMAWYGYRAFFMSKFNIPQEVISVGFLCTFLV